jgi:hypothetical protein
MARNPMNTPRLVGWLGSVVMLSACVPSYASVGYGPDDYYGRDYYGRRVVEIYDYSPGYYGDWRYNYRRWSPVVIYEYRGRYYPNRLRGARPLQVYRNRSGYFLPPRDRDWSRADRRFDPRRRPTDRDYRQARPRR